MRLDRKHIDAGLLSGKVPYIRAVILFGANALFKRLDTAVSAHRYARQVARLLPPHFRFTILGYEDVPPEQYTLNTIVTGLASAIRTQLGRPQLLMGVSFGGFVALRLAAEYPALLEQLILLVSAHRFSVNGRRLLQNQFKALEAGDFYRLARDNAVLFRRPMYNWLVRWKLWTERSSLTAQFKHPDLILRAYRGIFSDEFTRNADFAKRITAPALILGGEADQYFDLSCITETAALIPGSRLKVFQRETHMLPIERRRDVAAEIARFVEGAKSVC